MASRRISGYSRLPADESEALDSYDDDGGLKERRHDPRFDYTPKALKKVPWKSIALALFLLFLGLMLLSVAFFILTGHIGGEPSQAYGLLALGFLAFLPGFYETRIAYYSWRGASGYHFASIPDYWR